MNKILSILFATSIVICTVAPDAVAKSDLQIASDVVSSTSPAAQQRKASEANVRILEKYEVMVESQDKRLSDIWGAINILGYIAALLGVLTTAIVVFFSFKSSSTAIAEAKIEAGKSIEGWLKSNAETLLLEETKKVIAPQLDHALKEIKEAATPILVALDAELQKTVKLNEDLEAKIGSNKTAEADERSQIESVSTQQHDLVPTTCTQTSISHSVREGVNPDKSSLREAQKLIRENRYAEANSIIDSITERLEDSMVEQGQVMYIEAHYERIRILVKLGEHEKAVSEYAALASKISLPTSPNKAIALTKVLYAQALSEEEIGRQDDVVSTCDKLVSIYDQFNFTARADVMRLARAMNLKGKCLFAMTQFKLVVESYEDFRIRISDAALASFGNEIVATIMLLRCARSLIQLGQSNEAKEMLKTGINKYEESSLGRRFGETWRLKLLLSSIYEDENNYQESLAICVSIIQEYQQKGHKGSLSYVLQALLRKAAILSKLGLSQEEMRVYDEIVEMGSHKRNDDGTLMYPAYTVTALVNKAITLSKIGSSAEALIIANSVLAEFNASVDGSVIEQTTKAAKLKSVLER